jgi:hypothetical protein
MPAHKDAHEEGGFILRASDGTFLVQRWPRGVQNEIVVPLHPQGCSAGLPIVATFHTHPNPAPKYQQEPSLTDVRAVHDDPDLGGPEYEGEYVISEESIYRILKSGDVEEIGKTATALIP